jgi:hypothetical protein
MGITFLSSFQASIGYHAFGASRQVLRPGVAIVGRPGRLRLALASLTFSPNRFVGIDEQQVLHDILLPAV